MIQNFQNYDGSVLVKYPLTAESVVLEIGGYKGNWAAEIADLYDPYLFVFEPIKEFYDTLVSRFKDNPKVALFHFGLLDHNGFEEMMKSGDGTGFFSKSEERERIELQDIVETTKELGLEKIDLIQINCEGSEYVLLPHIISSGLVKRCVNIQVQYHDFLPNSEETRNSIRLQLMETHIETFNYPWIWEGWKIKQI